MNLKSVLFKATHNRISLTIVTLYSVTAVNTAASPLPGADSAPVITVQDKDSYKRANAMLKHGHLKEARQIFLRLSNTPIGLTNPALACKLAETYFHDDDVHNRLNLSAEQAQKAIRIAPDYSPGYRIMGSVAYEREHYAESVQWETKALSCKVPDKLALWIRASSYHRLLKQDAALADINKFLKSTAKPTWQHYAFKGDLLKSMGRTDEAIALYREAMPVGKDWAELQLVRCLESQNKLDEAIKELTGLIGNNPNDDDTFHLRAQLFVKKKDYKRALADYSKALELEPLSLYYKERAKVYDSLGQHDLAKRDLAEAQKSL